MKFSTESRQSKKSTFDDVTHEELLEGLKILEAAKRINIVGSTRNDRYLVKLLHFD
jgi:hypothetical protein